MLGHCSFAFICPSYNMLNFFHSYTHYIISSLWIRITYYKPLKSFYFKQSKNKTMKTQTFISGTMKNLIYEYWKTTLVKMLIPFVTWLIKKKCTKKQESDRQGTPRLVFFLRIPATTWGPWVSVLMEEQCLYQPLGLFRMWNMLRFLYNARGSRGHTFCLKVNLLKK